MNLYCLYILQDKFVFNLFTYEMFNIFALLFRHISKEKNGWNYNFGICLITTYMMIHVELLGSCVKSRNYCSVTGKYLDVNKITFSGVCIRGEGNPHH